MPLALPALSRATKLQKRATNIGFDWPNARGALNKLKEEVLELEELLDQAEQQYDLTEDMYKNLSNDMSQRLQDELGDVLFSSINVARKMSINSEQALRHANTKFVNRVDAVMAKLQQQLPETAEAEGMSAASDKVDSETLNKLWNAVKKEQNPP